jgi:mannose PTS system EIIA component
MDNQVMINIIVIAHAEIANSFAHCVEHILAKRINNLHILAVKKTEHTENILNNAKELIAKISKVRDDYQILVLADLFGATPSNIASKLVIKDKIELITGLNLPMLIRAISYSKEQLSVCVKKVLEGACEGIIHIDDNKGNNIDNKGNML